MYVILSHTVGQSPTNQLQTEIKTLYCQYQCKNVLEGGQQPQKIFLDLSSQGQVGGGES